MISKREHRPTLSRFFSFFFGGELVGVIHVTEGGVLVSSGVVVVLSKLSDVFLPLSLSLSLVVWVYPTQHPA